MGLADVPHVVRREDGGRHVPHASPGSQGLWRSPVKFFGGQSFMFIKHTNVYIVAASEGNAQVAITFQFLHTLVGVLKTYFGTIDEDSIGNNFVLIYELLDV